jgi:hypothetical protein
LELEIKVEVDEVDLGFVYCMYFTLYIFVCTMLINYEYKLEENSGKINKMFVLGVEHVTIQTFSHTMPKIEIYDYNKICLVTKFSHIINICVIFYILDIKF